MNETIGNTITSQLTTFKDDALTQFNTIIPLALGIVITVTIVFMAIHWFKGLSGVGK